MVTCWCLKYLITLKWTHTTTKNTPTQIGIRASTCCFSWNESRVNDQWINFHFEKKFQHSTKSWCSQEKEKINQKKEKNGTKAIKHKVEIEAVASTTKYIDPFEFAGWIKLKQCYWFRMATKQSANKTFQLRSLFRLLPRFSILAFLSFIEASSLGANSFNQITKYIVTSWKFSHRTGWNGTKKKRKNCE